MERSYAVAGFGRMPRQGADCVQVPLRSGHTRIVTSRLLRAAHGVGLAVHVWTVNDEATMHELLDLGIDGIMTADLHLLRRVFEGRSLEL